MNDLPLEIIRATVLAGVCAFLWHAGKKRVDLSRRGWSCILAGFALLLFGSLLDITDNFEYLGRFVVVGDTETQAILEKLVSYLGGFVVLAIGLIRWIPTVSSQDEVKRSEAKLRAMFEAIGDGVGMIGTDGHIVEVNEAWLHMFAFDSREDAIGTNAFRFVAEEDVDASRKHIENTMRLRREGMLEHTLRDDKGGTFKGETNTTAITDEHGEVVGLVGVTRDISQRKAVEEELAVAKRRAEAATQSKSEFLANMSHEIRTPMTAILGFADILLGEEGLEKAPRQRVEAFQTIKRNGEYLLELINDILDLSKIEAGKCEVERITCSPSRVVADVASLMGVRADAKGLPLEVEYIGGIPETILCDPTRLRQILINLVGNAIKFTETGSVRLVVRFPQISAKPPCLQFDVVDSGIGLTEDQMSKLFQPFMQADASTSRKHGGTGLGLAISKRLAEKLGGDITATSSFGRGSTFTVTVETGSLKGAPMIENLRESEAHAEAESKSTVPREKLDCRVLLAEDGPDNQRLISFVLKKAGAEVVVADNGQSAYDSALASLEEGSPFDVILMDMQMPIMDGYNATAKLRAAGYDGPIIALTANAMSTDRDKCLDSGCDEYTTKPIDQKRLISLVAEYAASQRPRRMYGSFAT